MSQPERGGMPTPHPQGVPLMNPTPLDHKTTVTGAQFPVVEEGEDKKNRLVLKEHVVIFHSTPGGTNYLVLELAVAEKIALDIYSAVKRMRTNIIVPGDGSHLRDVARDEMEKKLGEEEDATD